MTKEEMVKKAESMTIRAYNPKVLRKAIEATDGGLTPQSQRHPSLAWPAVSLGRHGQ